MKFQILLSCMNQKNFDIIKKSGIHSDTLIVNQTIEDSVWSMKMDKRYFEMINTTTRGLSKSRNIALKNMQAEICLLGDDDERFKAECEAMVIDAFEKLPEADIIAFQIGNLKKKLPTKVCKIGKIKSLRLSSVQLAFRAESIIKNNIKFDEAIGAGTLYSSGEENKFLFDCLSRGLKIYYVPITIATLKESGSTWFTGYNEEYFKNKGAITRYYMGKWFSLFYGVYFIISKHNLYKDIISIKKAAYLWLRAWKKNPIMEMKNKNDFL